MMKVRLVTVNQFSLPLLCLSDFLKIRVPYFIKLDLCLIFPYSNLEEVIKMQEREIDYVVWQEGKYYVSQCLNVNVSSFGETMDEAIANLKEAVELYFEDENLELPKVDKLSIGKEIIHV